MNPSFPRSIKAKRARLMLGIPMAHFIGHMELLWSSAIETGDPIIGDDKDVLLAAEWEGDAEDFIDTLLFVGMINLRSDDQYVLSPFWTRYAGRSSNG